MPDTRPLASVRLPSRLAPVTLMILVAALTLALTCSGGPSPHQPEGQVTFASPQVDPIALGPSGDLVLVANTANGTLDLIDAQAHRVISDVKVGLDPVSVAVRPDGGEAWVANHVSDSVSVVDLRPGPTRYQVVATIQDLDPATGATRFDEPVGIAFADSGKAYVALSSRNQVAIVDVNTRSVTGHIQVPSQEPRALRVRGGKLYVASFESGNQTELSTCPAAVFPIDGDQCTFDQGTLNFASNPNLVGAPVDIVRDPRQPDRDLYVYDTATDTLIEAVSHLGTLLYGLDVDGRGRAYVSLTEARNDANGRAGTQGQGLADLDNRIFLNQVATVDCSGSPCSAVVTDLEPLPPLQPAPGSQLATPYGIRVSGDDSTLVATAAASSRVFTMDAASGQVLGIADVGAIPRGIALRSDDDGRPETAWVLNTVDASVSVVDVSDPSQPVERDRIPLPDPTPEDVRVGRIAFNDANGSSAGTFSCASCHPDGNTDQLLWIIGARCSFGPLCNQEEPRSTMPIRGLRDTLPLHWDGVLGDPIGGTNGEVLTNPVAQVSFLGIPLGTETVPPNCTDEHSCFRHLVDAALSGVMCDTVACTTAEDELGLPGELTERERDAMAVFLRNVMYPPPRMRRPDDQLSASARTGFDDFFLNVGGINPPGPAGAGPETCADNSGGCHALPFGAGTNSPFVGGFEAPTMRGITDRYLLFSAGVTNVWEQLVFSPLISDAPWTPADGPDEFANWALAFGSAANPGAFRNIYNTGPFDIFQMIEEGSTGFPGIIGRQVTISAATVTPATRAAVAGAIAEMERADDRGLVNLRVHGRELEGLVIDLSYAGGAYVDETRGVGLQALLDQAQEGEAVATFTAALPMNADPDHPQPAIWVGSVGGFVFDGRLDLPQLPAANPMTISGRHVVADAGVFVDGVPVGGSVACVGGSFAPTCDSETLRVTLDAIPATGTHLLQLSTPDGLLSNEMPIVVQ